MRQLRGAFFVLLAGAASGCWVASAPTGPARESRASYPPFQTPTPITPVTLPAAKRRPLVIERFSALFEPPLVVVRDAQRVLGFVDDDGLLAIFDATVVALRRSGLEVFRDYEGGGRALPQELRDRGAVRLRVEAQALDIEEIVGGVVPEASVIILGGLVVDDGSTTPDRTPIGAHTVGLGDPYVVAGEAIAQLILRDVALFHALEAAP